MVTQAYFLPAQWRDREDAFRDAMMRGAGRFTAASLATAARWITDVEIRWIGCQPSARQRIYIANHSSHADFVLLWASLPVFLRERTRPVAAADYWKRGALRRFLIERAFHGVLIERDQVRRQGNPMAAMRQALDDGQSLIIFPEGTRGNGEQVQPFKCGIYHLLRERHDVELVPVWIGNLNRVLPRGAILPAPLRCSVSFGAPLRLEGQEDKKAFLTRAREGLIELGRHAKR